MTLAQKYKKTPQAINTGSAISKIL